MNYFSDFPDASRLWLYQTNRALTENEVANLTKEISTFVGEWAAHGDKLWATGAVLNPFFIGFVVDDTITPPSGCSIDASVKFLKKLGEELSIDFFTRMSVCYQRGDENSIKQIAFMKLSEIENPNEVLIYDSLVNNLGSLRKQWPIPLKESNFANVLP